MDIKWSFIVFTAFCLSGSLASWNYLHVKYALFNGYYGVPLTIDDAEKSGYVFMANDTDLNATLYTYAAGDPRFAIYFDRYRNIAGLHFCYIIADMGKRAASYNKTFPYNMTDKPMYTKQTYYGIDCWCSGVLFISPDQLKAGGRPSTGGVVAIAIYVKLNGDWTVMPKDECDVTSQGFTKQACFIGMGMHYFYQMTPTIDCNDLQGVFLLYECGQLIGLGIIPFGSFTSGSKRTWYEDPPTSVVKRIVPNRPACLEDWVTYYGTTSIHIFFKKYPRLTFCIWPWQKSKDYCDQRRFDNGLLQ